MYLHLEYPVLSLPIAKGTVRSLRDPEGTTLVPTVTDTAYQEGLISHKIVGISFAPVTAYGEINGELTFGYVDESKYVDSLNTM